MSTSASESDDSSTRLYMLEQCADHFSQLQADFYEEFRIYELSTLAVAVVYPLVGILYVYSSFIWWLVISMFNLCLSVGWYPLCLFFVYPLVGILYVYSSFIRWLLISMFILCLSVGW
jgi:hypothetical protein